MNQSTNDNNRSNQMNPNNETYHSSRGDTSSYDSTKASMDNHSNQMNPNHSSYSSSRGSGSKKDRGYSHHNQLRFPKVIIYLSVILVFIIQLIGFVVALGFLIKSVVNSSQQGKEQDFTFQYINISILLFHGGISLIAVGINIFLLLMIFACWKPLQLTFYSKYSYKHQTNLIVVIILLALILVCKALTNFIEASLLLTSELCGTTEFLITCVNGFFLGLVPALLVTEFVDLFSLEEVLYPEKQSLLVRDAVQQRYSEGSDSVNSRRTSVDTSATPLDFGSVTPQLAFPEQIRKQQQQQQRPVASPLTTIQTLQ